MASSPDNYVGKAKPKQQRSISPIDHDDSRYEFEKEFRYKRSKSKSADKVGSVDFLEKIAVQADSNHDETVSTQAGAIGIKRYRSPSVEIEEEETAPREIKKLKGVDVGELDSFVPAVSFSIITSLSSYIDLCRGQEENEDIILRYDNFDLYKPTLNTVEKNGMLVPMIVENVQQKPEEQQL
jgi:hypothetical protein